MKKGRWHEHNHTENQEKKNEDRLSDLPDCVLLHIMSFLTTKQVVQTSILSTRWNNMWRFLPKLTLDSSHFSVVSQILSRRDDSTALHTLNFQPSGEGLVEPQLLEKIIEYAVSHDVKRLHMKVICDIEHFTPCLFSCQTLTYLNLMVIRPKRYDMILFPNSLNLPALTNLSLRNFVFVVGNDGRVEPFLGLNKLKSLILNRCEVFNYLENLCISSTTLILLKIIAPMDFCKIELSTPNLFNFYFKGIPGQKLCGSDSNLASIKHASIFVGSNFKDTPLILLNWLVELANIESLTVSRGTLELLSSVPNLLKIEFPSLCNLKSLNLKSDLPWSCIPNFRSLVKFFRRNSPSVEINKVY